MRNLWKILLSSTEIWEKTHQKTFTDFLYWTVYYLNINDLSFWKINFKKYFVFVFCNDFSPSEQIPYSIVHIIWTIVSLKWEESGKTFLYMFCESYVEFQPWVTDFVHTFFLIYNIKTHKSNCLSIRYRLCSIGYAVCK